MDVCTNFSSCFWKFGKQKMFNNNHPVFQYNETISIIRGVARAEKKDYTLHKKWSFPLRISSVNVTKSAGNCEFGHIYWRNPEWKISFFVQWYKFCSRRSRSQMFFKIGVLKKCWKFHRKTTVLESLFNKGAGLVCNFIKKILTQVFSCDICDIFKNTFFAEV